MVHELCCLDNNKTETHCTQTSMFVPDPVVSLAIKPIGTEIPNFSLVLNQFQKEDPTFRVHVDHKSKEVYLFQSICHHELIFCVYMTDNHIRYGQATP